MYIELWEDFDVFMWSLYPALNVADKETCIMVTEWGRDQDNRYSGIPQIEIDFVFQWLQILRDYYTGELRNDLSRAMAFMLFLNTIRQADTFFTETGCRQFRYYWYDNACHTEPTPVKPPFIPPPEPPPPEPEPPEPPPPDPGIGELLVYDLELMINFDKELGYDIAKKASAEVDKWNIRLGDYYIWSDIIAALERLIDWINYPLGTIKIALEDLDKRIGDTTELGGLSLVEAILAKSTDASDILNLVMDEIGVFYTPATETAIARVDLAGGGMMENLHDIINQWEALEKQLGGIVLDDVKSLLSTDYHLMVGTIDSILARLDYIQKEIGVTTEEIIIDMDELRLEPVGNLDWIIPASKKYVKDYVLMAGNKILEIVADPMNDILDNQNIIIRNVLDISEPWLTALKEKLGDVAGEYELENDTLYQELRSEVNVIIDEVYELSDVWVSILANRLEGYFSIGIGEKGEKGDPGLPGARGVPGIPGVQGEKGEPGEGAGMAIEDIDSQLKERLVFGAAIVTDNVTGVIDYNIEKIGEIFTRYDLEVKPITEFLTTDMQESLTGIIAAFDTPEALIAFILDVPEGQEDVTYELMQLLIAQTMQRGLE